MTSDEVKNQSDIFSALQVLRGTRCYGAMDIAKGVILDYFAKQREIFEGMADGEIVLTLYPHCEFYEHGDIVTVTSFDPYCRRQYDYKWWHTPYKK